MIKIPQFKEISAKIKGFSRREKIILFGALIFVSLALVDRLVIRSFLGIVSGLDKQISDKEAQIKAGLKVTALKDRIELQHVNYKSYLGGSKAENEEFTSILKELDSLAPAQPGFNLLDMKPAGVKESSSVKKYLVALNCEGTMEKIAEFMYNVETAAKLFAVEKCEITPKSRDTNLARCSMSISSLVLP
ncbi:MAG: hypothetical protein V1919_01600, partial [Candidatus Omnitrophota bacterium]